MKMDLDNLTTSAILLSPQRIASATTVNGTGIDVTTYGGRAKATLALGTLTGTLTIDVKLQESDTVGGTYTDITGAAFAQQDETADDSVLEIGFDVNASKSFVRATVTTAGTVTSVDLSCTLQAIQPTSLPV